MRIAAKIDANQPEIVKALRKIGCTVEILSAVGKGCPDIIVGYNMHSGIKCNVFFEIKDGAKPKSARKLTPDQVKWHEQWQGAVYVVDSVDDALKIIGELR